MLEQVLATERELKAVIKEHEERLLDMKTEKLPDFADKLITAISLERS